MGLPLAEKPVVYQKPAMRLPSLKKFGGVVEAKFLVVRYIWKLLLVVEFAKMPGKKKTLRISIITTRPLPSGNLLIGVGAVVVANEVDITADERIFIHCGFTSPVPPVSWSPPLAGLGGLVSASCSFWHAFSLFLFFFCCFFLIFAWISYCKVICNLFRTELILFLAPFFSE